MLKSTDTSHKRKENKKKQEEPQILWILRIFCIAITLSALLSLLSEAVLGEAGLVLALMVLMVFILLGILFDIVGVAVTAADPKPFHSMASHKTKGAAEALRLLNSAERVSSICNDVVGDICGIVSGTTAAVIVLRLREAFSLNDLLMSVVVTALISGMTIGGKAMGKNIAIRQSTKVVYFVGRMIRIVHPVRKQR